MARGCGDGAYNVEIVLAAGIHVNVDSRREYVLLSQCFAQSSMGFSVTMLTLALEPVVFLALRIPLTFGLFRALPPISLARSAVRVVRFHRLRHREVMPEFIAGYKTR